MVELYDNGGPKLTLPDPDQLDTQAPTKLQAPSAHQPVGHLIPRWPLGNGGKVEEEESSKLEQLFGI